MVITDPAERLIGAHLIHMVDEAGYLQGDLDELADKLGAPRSLHRQGARRRCRASTRRACSRATWPNAWRCSSRSRTATIRRSPGCSTTCDLLGSHNLAALKRAVGVDAQELAEMIAEIKRLNPKPGLKFGSVQIQPVLPDVLVRPARDGSWMVELNNDTLPRVLVNRSYYATVSKTARSEQGQAAICSNACRTPTGWSRASISAPAPSCAWPRRSCASRTAFSPTASST